MLSALCLLPMLTACVASGSSKVLPVTLPPAPACMAPVALPEIRAGDDARSAIASHRASLAKANKRLECSRKWYGGVRKSFSQ
jgi:hypothetical protein